MYNVEQRRTYIYILYIYAYEFGPINMLSSKNKEKTDQYPICMANIL
jgi:hypothetical protein